MKSVSTDLCRLTSIILKIEAPQARSTLYGKLRKAAYLRGLSEFSPHGSGVMKISTIGKPSHVEANRNSHRFRRPPPDEFGASCQGGHDGRGRGTDWLLLCVAHVQAEIKKVRFEAVACD